MSSKAKRFVYRYDDGTTPDDMEIDRDGDIPDPVQRQIISRHGKEWKVVAAIVEQTVAGPPAIQLVRVYLTGRL